MGKSATSSAVKNEERDAQQTEDMNVVAKTKTTANNAEEEDARDDDEEETDDVFEVERVVGHENRGSGLYYHIKWKGYSNDDNTWEHNKSVFCKDLVAEYWKRYEAEGGKKSDSSGKDPKPQTSKRASSVGSRSNSGGSKRGNASGSKSTQAQEPLLPKVLPMDETVPSTKRASKETDTATAKKQKSGRQREDSDEEMSAPLVSSWTPPKAWTSWEEHVDHVSTVERSNKRMKVHLAWKNGHDTEHPIEDAHTKCPLKLIQFYESHLKFTQA
ncbi:Chromobox protein 1 [Lunasporangiospora selenospora]|uniref:Chromobox protein 1 n=1 Tax=Lunasporangiospora selenospora TaxID=979761 RepID=A0A9P6FXW4_9FUNG|nr:Chromobox protein 1 [Lunasporangiospora selenospora]